MTENLIDKARLNILKEDFNPRTSPWTHKVVMFVLSTQGIMDNGGFKYFFGAPFDDDPDLNEFVKAFVEIKADECAYALEKAIEKFRSGDNEFGKLENIFFDESEANYLKLEEYIRDQKIA